MINLTDDTFRQALNSAMKPMLLVFRAGFCGPSAAIDPLLDQLEADFSHCMEIGIIDVEECPRVTREMSVKGTPTLIIFELGKALASRIGTMTYDELADWIEDYCKND